MGYDTSEPHDLPCQDDVGHEVPYPTPQAEGVQSDPEAAEAGASGQYQAHIHADTSPHDSLRLSLQRLVTCLFSCHLTVWTSIRFTTRTLGEGVSSHGVRCEPGRRMGAQHAGGELVERSGSVQHPLRGPKKPWCGRASWDLKWMNTTGIFTVCICDFVCL